MGCGENGGQLVVQVNASNPVYRTDQYKATEGTPEGIIIKIVKAAAPPPAQV